jgi:hypothetical protein
VQGEPIDDVERDVVTAFDPHPGDGSVISQVRNSIRVPVTGSR